MGAIIAMGIKGADGKYYNYTISIYDTPDQYGNNVAMWVEQTAEQRQNKAPKQYVGNGKVIWTDEKIVVAARKQQQTSNSQLPPPIMNVNTNQNYPNQNNQVQTNPNNAVNPENDYDFYSSTNDDLPPF